LRCTSFKLTSGNLENCLTTHGAYDCPSRPNATFNLAHTVRRNSFEGLSSAIVWFTQDTTAEFNALLPARCTYNGADMPPTPVNFTSPIGDDVHTNSGMLYRP
jgi:hypothetical protein